VASAEEPNAAQLKAMQDAATQNPEVMKAVQEQMARPEVQQEMQQMMSMMNNPDMLAKVAALREDPELKPMFDEIRAGGMAGMMKAMNDPTFLAKIGEKMGDVAPNMAGAPIPAAPQPTPPEVNSILDAARYGDLEAIDDYMAIGKGDIRDENGRTALHYAVAYNQGAAAGALLEAGADVNATDSNGNSALHFAAGYGRGSAVRALLTVGANVALKNAEGKSAADIVAGEQKNPLNQDTELMDALQGKSSLNAL